MRKTVIAFVGACWLAASALAADLPLNQIQLPPGFKIELLARVPNARAMALGKNNVLYIGSMGEGKVYGLELDAQYRAGTLHVLASGLNMPVGVAYRDGNLYVSAVERLLRLDVIDTQLKNPPKPTVIRADLPKEKHHGWRFIRFGPDGLLYVPVGAPCNICEPDPDKYANILRMRADGSNTEVVARGVRNTVGFDWDPANNELWFTDNGRDMLGDDLPPDELNRLSKPGQHFGYPYCHAGTIADPDFGAKRSCKEFVPPVQTLGAHVAALGMRFYTGNQFPAEYKGQVFIAEHGSWNRSKKVGYRISLVKLNDGKAVSYTPFATGWLQGEAPWGRPADVQMLPDGSLLVADDFAGAIYRISYSGAAR
ncbi:sorbosone dehydrogenase family protein [Massilia sp. TS11]|uniref:PQQ-dependent sugar dehydrogenase n=1 Tax=Massilia sp. TS11 TaxID=2908003 RepID=UPI001EDB3F55|nr:sorbosone dehydrogenase family protein [Massilia sp. TS11]MCG2584325.1 sorbosone dehydrogenase family protein [Massilia sp. TS11]